VYETLVLIYQDGITTVLVHFNYRLEGHVQDVKNLS
jgi:hypothetical protein